jgi:hypothetical protein
VLHRQANFGTIRASDETGYRTHSVSVASLYRRIVTAPASEVLGDGETVLAGALTIRRFVLQKRSLLKMFPWLLWIIQEGFRHDDSVRA